MKSLLILLSFLYLVSCNGQQKKAPAPETPLKVVKTPKQWRQGLTADQYHILREKGTERPFTGEFDRHFETGHYACAGCGQKLFESGAKFESDCGWPSFDQAIKGAVIYKTDLSFGMDRTEVTCSACGGHLGHVFDDGPKKTTGQRYCMNSVAMKFIPSEQ